MSRKYAMTQIGPGDYLCPSNDQMTLWRFRKYEDGRCGGLDVAYECRTFWMVQRAPMPHKWLDGDNVDALEWREVASHLTRRRDAVAAAFDA